MALLGTLQIPSTHEQEPTLHSSTSCSLSKIFNFITTTTTTTTSSSCSWNPKFDPIDFKTSSITCPRALNVLLGRRFSLTTGSPLNPPPCSLSTNGCTCHNPSSSSPTQIASVPPKACNNQNPSLQLGGGMPLLSNSKSIGENGDPNPSETGILDPNSSVAVFSSLIRSIDDGEIVEGEIVDESQLGFLHGMDGEDPKAIEPNNSVEISHILKSLESVVNISGDEDHVRARDDDDVGLLETLPAASEMLVPEEIVKMLQEGDMEEGEIPCECLDKEECARIGCKLLGEDENEMGSTAIDKDRIGDLDSRENRRGKDREKKSVKNKKVEVKQKNSKKKPTENKKGEVKQSPKVMKDQIMVRLDAGAVVQNGSQEIAAQDQEMASAQLNVKIPEKRKRVPLTKERKAKKKEAKKRKRAQLNRELGVKRLKLPPILIPRKVHNCVFYMQGRCQQADKCKFSHDFTPSTKSQPCKYLIGERCLKGDDCPFDHDLSKYPCHNFQANGTCSRGDKCLFSHKLPPAEAISGGAPKVSKPDLQSPPDKTNIKKPLNANASTTKSSLMKQQTSEIMLSPPAQAPEGISFLSFGKTPLLDDNKLIPPAQAPEGISFLSFGKTALLDDNKLQQEKKPDSYSCQAPKSSEDDGNRSPPSVIKKSRLYSSQTPRSGEDDGNKNYPSGGCKAVLQTLAFAEKYESEMMAVRPFRVPGQADNNGLGADNSKGGSKNVSKILQEFLFGVRG